MDTTEIMKLCNQIRETAYEIHRYHGTGYLEKVYENALAHRLRKAGLEVKQQHRLIVRDEDGAEIGEYFADLLVENELIIELKACKSIKEEHKAQLLNYLKGAGMEHGLLINFGSYKFFIKKYARRAKTNPITKLASLLLPLFAFLAFFRG
ncbi:MAG: GxxExxY protein [Verrucomicrobia bacterium]|nr:MAG: GxxExxY protein [Verrucomicrobiota bacterium]